MNSETLIEHTCKKNEHKQQVTLFYSIITGEPSWEVKSIYTADNLENIQFIYYCPFCGDKLI